MPGFPAVCSYRTTMPHREIQAMNSASQVFTDWKTCNSDQDGTTSVWAAWDWTLLGSSAAFWNKQGGKRNTLSRIGDSVGPASFPAPFYA